MSEITEDSLIWTALDAPKLVPANWDLFWEQWNKHAGASYIKGPDPAGNKDSKYAKTGVRTAFFKGINLYAKDEKDLVDGSWELPYIDYKEIFPNLLDDIYKAMPWVEELLVCRLWNSVIDIPYHSDHTLENVALRAMIYDENSKGTFKLWKPGINRTYVDLPEETNWFAYNNAKCLHGSDKTEGVNKIILLIVHKTKSKEQMIEHFKSSAEKYPESFLYYP
jgi:hypothetical protein